MVGRLLLLLLLASTTFGLSPGRNSTRDFPSPTATVEPSPAPPLLRDILRAIREQWRLDNTSFSNIKIRNAKAGVSHRHEFYLQVGKTMLTAKFSDEVKLWKRLRRKGAALYPGMGFLGPTSLKPVLKSLEFEGPLELAIMGEDAMPLKLPMNITLTGFRRVLVGEGITLSVKGAQQVSLVDPFNFGMPCNKSFSSDDRSWLWSLGYYTSCIPLLHIQVARPSSVFAYRNLNSKGHIQTEFLSQDTVQLLSEKCYTGQRHNNGLGHPAQILKSRLVLLDKLLGSFLGDYVHRKGGFRVWKVKIAASILVQFELELEKEVASDEEFLESLPIWSTRPITRRFWFDVIARLDGDDLKPVIIKKVRPFVVMKSVALSSLLSNASFGRLSSIRVSPGPFTLNLKW